MNVPHPHRWTHCCRRGMVGVAASTRESVECFFFSPAPFSKQLQPSQGAASRTWPQAAGERAVAVGDDKVAEERSLAVDVRPGPGRARSEARKARWAAKARRPHQRLPQAAATKGREGGGWERALACARRRTKVATSELQRPPTSRLTTTSRQRVARG